MEESIFKLDTPIPIPLKKKLKITKFIKEDIWSKAAKSNFYGGAEAIKIRLNKEKNTEINVNLSKNSISKILKKKF